MFRILTITQKSDWKSLLTELVHDCYCPHSKAAGFSPCCLLFDHSLCAIDLQVHNLSESGGPGKLSSYWEDKVNVVMKSRSADSPVNEVICYIGTFSYERSIAQKWVKDTELGSEFKSQTKGQWDSQRSVTLSPDALPFAPKLTEVGKPEESIVETDLQESMVGERLENSIESRQNDQLQDSEREMLSEEETELQPLQTWKEKC